jgi:hypothetical protein
VVVDDLDILRSIRGPNETDTPLVIDPDAVLAFPIALEGLQAIAWGYPQVVQRRRPVELLEFAQGGTFHADPAPDPSPEKQGLRILAMEASNDHGRY